MNAEAVKEVALNSRTKAEAHLSQGNWGRAFAHLLLCVKLQPSAKSDLQSAISNCLSYWGEQLEKEGRHQDLLHCYQQALEVYPDDHEVLTNLGAHLFRVLSSHFPIKKLRKHVSTIFGCFEILSAGIKPAFVWDFFTADLQQLQQAVAHLKSEALVHSETTVLALSQGDLFVVHRDTLMQTLARHAVTINASGAKPEIVDKSADVCKLSTAVKVALGSDSRLVAESGPAIIGLLLGYPVIYWLHPDAEENCLGSVPLIVFKVHGEHCKTAREHFVTSFSVPADILANDIREKVREWFRLNFVEVEQCIFMKLKLEEERVSLPFVVLGHLREAKNFFEKALKSNKDFLPAVHNLENLASALVERWHFRMLNDANRNESYREAILKKVRQGYTSVLDIGTGTSLFSLYAVAGGANRVFACECSPAMIDIASQVIQKNGAQDEIELIPKLSNNIEIPQDMPCRVSLVVTETMDAGLLGEHVLQTLVDAWDRLLLPPCSNLFSPNQSRRHGIVIPYGSCVYVAGVQCPYIARGAFLPVDRWEALQLGQPGLRLSALTEEAYDSEDLAHVPGGFVMVTAPARALEINFNDPEELRHHLLNPTTKKVELTCCETGHVDAFVSWFVLQLDEDLRLSSEPGKDSCWEQAVFKLNASVELQTMQKIDVNVSASQGVLKVQMPQELTSKSDCEIPPGAIKFLNNTVWIKKLQNVAETFVEKTNLSVLDLSPFPYCGLLLAKKGIAKTVTHNCPGLEQLVKKLSLLATVEYVEGISQLKDDMRYDVVLIEPVTSEGDLNQETFLDLPQIMKRLQPEGKLFPSSFSIIGQLWHSPWLDSVSRLLNDSNVSDFNISEVINSYQLSKHFDLSISSSPHSALSRPTCLMTHNLNGLLDGVATTSVRVTSTGVMTAVAFWFEFDMGHGIKLSSEGPESHIRQAAIFTRPEISIKLDSTVDLVTRVQSGLLDIVVSVK